jgi:group I intron endonuclease
MAIVYLITNIENGKFYVGKTKGTLKSRWYNHCREAAQGRGFALHAAIRKYGFASFNCKVLGEYSTEEEALVAERDWVLQLGAMGPKGYNLCEGGRGALGMVWTEERREKMVALLNTPEATAKMSQASREAKSSLEFRAKVSAEVRALWADPVVKASRSAAIAAGRKVNPHTPENLAQAAIKRQATLAKKRALRTHFDCKVHGPLLLEDCYSKMRKNGLRTYECPTCVLAAQKALQARKKIPS